MFSQSARTRVHLQLLVDSVQNENDDMGISACTSTHIYKENRTKYQLLISNSTPKNNYTAIMTQHHKLCLSQINNYN